MQPHHSVQQARLYTLASLYLLGISEEHYRAYRARGGSRLFARVGGGGGGGGGGLELARMIWQKNPMNCKSQSAIVSCHGDKHMQVIPLYGTYAGSLTIAIYS